MFKKIFPFLAIIFVTVLVFRKFFFQGLLPIPSDILIGAYFPWLDYKWGYPIAVPVKNPLPSDVISIIYPWRILGMNMIKSGLLPLWDSTILLGTPLLANFQAAILNPFNIVFFFFAHAYAWSTLIIVQPVLIAITTFFYLKNLGIQKIAAVFGGLTFAFSGFSIVWMEYGTIGFTLAYLPLIFLLIDKIITKPKVGLAFWLGLFLCLQILSGYPQMTIYTICFSIIYFAFRLYLQKGKPIFKLAIYLLGISSAFVLSAVQLLPSLELIRLSIRSVDNTALTSGLQFLPLKHIITFFIPDFFGNPATANYWSGGSYDNFAFFIPVIAIYFIALAFLSKITFQKKNLIFLVIAILSLILATDNILSRALIQINFLGLKSTVAARSLFIFDFAVAIIASVGLNHILSTKNISIYHKIAPVIGFLGLIILAGTNKVALRNSLIPIMTVIFGFGIMVCFYRFKTIFVTLIFILLTFNILVATDKYFSFSPANLLYPQESVIKNLQNNIGFHRFEREKGEIFPSNTWSVYGLRTSSGQNALSLTSFNKYIGLVNNTYPSFPARFIDITNFSSPLLDTLDIKYVVALNRRGGMFGPDINGWPKKEFVIPTLHEDQTLGTVKIFENKSNLGSAWFSKNIVCQNNENQAAKILIDQNYHPDDLMIIDCPLDQGLKDRIKGSVNVLQDDPLYAKLQVNTENKNYLNISKAIYPGWQVFVDGKKTNLKTANLALMAVLIPEGEHTVELKYKPQSFYIGFWISLGSLGVWILYLVFSVILKKYNKGGRFFNE